MLPAPAAPAALPFGVPRVMVTTAPLMVSVEGVPAAPKVIDELKKPERPRLTDPSGRATELVGFMTVNVFLLPFLVAWTTTFCGVVPSHPATIEAGSMASE